MDQARQFIQQAGDKLAAVLNGPGDWPAKERSLRGLVAGNMDVEGIARFALGRFWNMANGPQREEFVRLFPIVLLGQLGRSVGVLHGMSFTVDRSVSHADWVEVWTTVYRPGNAPRSVDWLVGSLHGQPRIIDIYAEGSSLRITQREDVASFMAQHGYSMDQLLVALRNRVAEG